MPSTSSSSSTTCSPHRGWWVGGVLLLLLLALVVVYAVCDPAGGGRWSALFPRCPVRWLTGLSCPGCGVQRAVHALLNGHPAEALACNPFLAVAVPYVLALGVAWVARGCGCRSRVLCIVEHRYGVYAFLVLFVIWFVVRNVWNI